MKKLVCFLLLVACSSAWGGAIPPFTTIQWRHFLDGATAEFQADSDSTTFFQVKDSSGTVIFTIDTTNGNTFIGDGGTTNYAKFDSNGQLTLAGTARVTVDNYITASGVKAPGSNPAAFIEYGIVGAWEFDDQGVAGNQEQISGTLKLPTQMDKTEAPYFKIGWSANGVSPGNCEWQLEYLYRSPNEDTTAAAQATITVTSTASSTSDGLIIATFSALALPSATDQAMFYRITRLSAGGNDTIVDTTEIRGMLFTHTRNKLGNAWFITAENVVYSGENVIYAGEQVVYP